MTKIINWKTQETIIEDKNLSIKELVEKAVINGISLVYADLREANLCGADLHYAFLRRADLRDTDLTSADMRSADIRGAKINQDQMHDLLKALGVKII